MTHMFSSKAAKRSSLQVQQAVMMMGMRSDSEPKPVVVLHPLSESHILSASADSEHSDSITDVEPDGSTPQVDIMKVSGKVGSLNGSSNKVGRTDKSARPKSDSVQKSSSQKTNRKNSTGKRNSGKNVSDTGNDHGNLDKAQAAIGSNSVILEGTSSPFETVTGNESETTVIMTDFRSKKVRFGGGKKTISKRSMGEHHALDEPLAVNGLPEVKPTKTAVGAPKCGQKRKLHMTDKMPPNVTEHEVKVSSQLSEAHLTNNSVSVEQVRSPEPETKYQKIEVPDGTAVGTNVNATSESAGGSVVSQLTSHARGGGGRGRVLTRRQYKNVGSRVSVAAGNLQSTPVTLHEEGVMPVSGRGSGVVAFNSGHTGMRGNGQRGACRGQRGQPIPGRGTVGQRGQLIHGRGSGGQRRQPIRGRGSAAQGGQLVRGPGTGGPSLTQPTHYLGSPPTKSPSGLQHGRQTSSVSSLAHTYGAGASPEDHQSLTLVHHSSYFTLNRASMEELSYQLQNLSANARWFAGAVWETSLFVNRLLAAPGADKSNGMNGDGSKVQNGDQCSGDAAGDPGQM